MKVVALYQVQVSPRLLLLFRLFIKKVLFPLRWELSLVHKEEKESHHSVEGGKCIGKVCHSTENSQAKGIQRGILFSDMLDLGVFRPQTNTFVPLATCQCK